MEKQYYTYLWLREDGTPYYVGKGSGRRAHTKHDHRLPPPPAERIIVQEFESEEDAFFAEKFLIAAYGREDLSEGRLLNLTNGGENPPKFNDLSAFGQTLYREKLSTATKSGWEDPAIRESRLTGLRRVSKDSEHRIRKSAAQKKVCEDQKVRDIRRHRMIKRYEDPLEREKTGLETTKRYENPKAREKTSRASQGISNSSEKKTSKYIGVCWEKRRSAWRVTISQKTQIYIGQFVNEIEAAMAYDQAALKYFGESAKTNFPI